MTSPLPLSLPATQEQLACLRAGQSLLLSGTVYTARDAAHLHLRAMHRAGVHPCVDLHGAALYYCGPCPAPEGRPIGSCGPTTAGRMDETTPDILKMGVRVLIGKGPRAPYVAQALRSFGAVYLAAPGGAGALLASCVVSSRLAAFDPLGTEALWQLELKDFPAIVAIDTAGGDIYTAGPQQARRMMEEASPCNLTK
nr:FumA C-terminus/TtdB family hydratase beta subunit [bacterium]